MQGASSRRHTPRYKTEPLDLQAIPAPAREAGAVAQVRILHVGSKTAARSGSTRQIPWTVQPGAPPPPPERPQVIYARPVQAPPPRRARDLEDMDDDHNVFKVASDSVFEAPRQRIAELQVRAARALSGLSANLPTQRIEAGKTWSKPSTRVMCIAVGLYTLVLFLFALFGR